MSKSQGLLSGELIDSLIEAVVLPADALARSAVICDLLNEVCDAVDWLNGSATQPDSSIAAETASLQQLVVAAQEHRLRMRALCNGAVGHRGER